MSQNHYCCIRCGKPLTTDESRALGIGPECRKKPQEKKGGLPRIDAGTAQKLNQKAAKDKNFKRLQTENRAKRLQREADMQAGRLAVKVIGQPQPDRLVLYQCWECNHAEYRETTMPNLIRCSKCHSRVELLTVDGVPC